MFTFIAIVAGSAVLISGVVAVAYTATKIKNDLDAANSAISEIEASTDIVTSNVRNKVKLTSDGEKIIGLKDGSLIKAQSTLTTVDFDTTEYGDRAVLQLRNDTGSTITLTGLSIRGKPVKQLSGANGYVWEYSDYDDIEKNGENFVEVSNDFIFSPFQAKSIGDFVWKELRPHKMYSLTLIGTQYQYEIGQIWHLTLSYSLDGHTMEDIDTDVEVMGISLSRSVGGVGTTALSLRVPSAAWELTLAKNAKLVGAGNSQRLANRSNIVTVASSTWTGQADYFCDGVNDEVEIQAAIDYITSIGGGEVIIYSGNFYIGSTIIIKSNVFLHGCGMGTILAHSNDDINTVEWENTSALGSSISDFMVYGNNKTMGAYIVRGKGVTLSVSNIAVSGFNNNPSVSTYIFDGCNNISSCSIYNNNYSVSVPTSHHMFSGCYNISLCEIKSNTFSGPYGSIYFVWGCKNVSNIYIHSNTSTMSGSGVVRGFYICDNVSSCIFESNTAANTIESFASCNNLSSSLSSSNYSSSNMYSFRTCKRITVCSTSSNSSGGILVGFSSCKSIQQCNSTGDTYPYGAGIGQQSYSDSGTTNACADTAAGGYNS